MHEGEPDEINLRDKDSQQSPHSHNEPRDEYKNLEKSLSLHVRKSIHRNLDEFGRKKGVSVYK